MSRAISRWSVLAAALAVTATALVGAAPAAQAYPADSVQFDGHGWGHGRGLGQYGSLGYSVVHGWTYSQIIDHYYGGTTTGTVADGPVTVRLAQFDNKPMVVGAGSPFTVGSFAFAAGDVALVQHSAAGYDVSRATRCVGPFTKLGTLPPTSVPTATTAYEGDDVNQMLRACAPTGNVYSYRGTLKLVASAKSTWVVNTLPMEQYLRGVVPRESPASWGNKGSGKGMEALKAQTVAARSYAWAEQRSALFKTCDTIACQVYGGAALNFVRSENTLSDAAVAATAGEVRLNAEGRPARAEFSSSTGGFTAGGNFTAVPDAGDSVPENPNHNWSTTVPVTKIQAAYPALGTLQDIKVVRRNGLGSNGGRALSVVLTGTATTLTVTANDARSKLGLKSDWFYITDPTLNALAVGLATSGDGYVLTSTIGEAMSGHGGATYGSMEGKPLPSGATVVAVATIPGGTGYWLVGNDGSVFNFGAAPAVGTLRGTVTSAPIVGAASTATGQGLWLVGRDGAVYALGDATVLGSMAGKRLNAPMLGMAATVTGKGYWLLGRDGGVFSFGDARFYGSTGNMRLNKPILGMTADPQGHGYWFTASDGGVFTFIDQPNRFYGSAGATKLDAPIVGMAASRTGAGYWLLGQKGAVYAYGDAAAPYVPPTTTTTTTSTTSTTAP
jgi:SpoIID/LytB domain protein